MKRRWKLVAVPLALGVAAWLLYVRICTTYAFGVPEREHPELFQSIHQMKWDREHSWLTPLPVGKTTIEVEHLTVATEEDRGGLSDQLAAAAVSP